MPDPYVSILNSSCAHVIVLHQASTSWLNTPTTPHS